jgi:hypothetical protein
MTSTLYVLRVSDISYIVLYFCLDAGTLLHAVVVFLSDLLQAHASASTL